MSWNNKTPGRENSSYFEVLFLEEERRDESSPRLGKVDLNETVSLLPRCLPKSPIGLPHNNEPLLKGKKKKREAHRVNREASLLSHVKKKVQNWVSFFKNIEWVLFATAPQNNPWNK